MKKPSLFTTVSPELDEQVKRHCAENGGISEAAFLRQAITEKLTRDKKQA
jgi:hypothetical protein